MLCSIVSNFLRHYSTRSTGKILVRRHCTKTLSNLINKISSPKCIAPIFGQPVPSTHPHLLSPGELLPGIKVGEFKARRRNFMELIMDDVHKTYGKAMHVVVIIPSATKTYMTENIPYVFRQNTDFLYLSGCLEPDTALILYGSDSKNFISTILVRPPDDRAQLWDGPRTGVKDAVLLFGVDEADDMNGLSQYLDKIAGEHPDYLLFYDLHTSNGLPCHNTIVSHIQKRGITLCRTGTYFLHKLRLIKSPAEQNLMRKAGEVSAEAVNRAIQVTRPGLSEHQLFATVDYESRMRGAEILAYVPVVASGSNANTIHYIDNRQMLDEGELVLMDAGCEYHGYSGDISRTWPVNGKFNKYQRILYELVLEVQLRLISLCHENMTLEDIHRNMVHLLGMYIVKEKILSRNVTSIEEQNAVVCELCPHHSSHYLGMDIHDVKTVRKNEPLKPGMVLTVEPGLYIRENDTKLMPEFRNMGIRIEDDILITDTGFEVLSSKCCKTVDDIENLMKK